MSDKPSTPAVYKAPMVFCVAVFAYEAYAYNFVFLLEILPAVDKQAFVPLLAVVFNTCWIMAAWTYMVVHVTDAGTITDQWRSFIQNTAGLDVIVSRQEWQPGKVTTNKKSNEIRPERAHFCSTTCKDILRMDHFCPWTGNCVGFGNHKHFLLLGFYGALAGAVGLVTALPELVGCATKYDGASEWDSIELHTRMTFLLFGFLALVVCVLLTGLFASHFPLACRNMTTIEELYTNMPNPYDQQNWFQNLAVIFGRFGPDWFLPVEPRHPTSDGFSYRRNGEVLPEGLVEVYGQDQRKPEAGMELVHRIPEDIWHFRYTGYSRPSRQEPTPTPTSWFSWLSGGG